ncbi:hypothetical protein [Thermocatellispora tengchongensis]
MRNDPSPATRSITAGRSGEPGARSGRRPGWYANNSVIHPWS